MGAKKITRYRKNLYTGHTGFRGTELDQTECELYDDLPTPTIKELTLQVLAGGQIAENRRRAAFYDTDEEINPEDINEIDAGTGAEEFDYIQAYQQERERNLRYFKARQEKLAKEAEEQTKKEEEKQPEQQPE